MTDFNPNSEAPKIPAIIGIEGITDPATKRVLQAVKEILEIRMGQRPRTSGMDTAVTFRDLYKYNIASFTVNGQTVTNESPETDVLPINPGFSSDDSVIPGAPLGLIASGTKLSVLLEWNAGATKIAYTEIYRSEDDNLGNAVLIGTTTATIYADILNEAGLTRYYWIRFANPVGIFGDYNAIVGTVATTGGIGSSDIISVDGAKIIDATILNAKIANVSADKIVTGTLQATQVINVGAAANRIFIDGQGIIRSGGMLSYLNGSGFYMRAVSGTAHVSFGNATNYIGFNGADLAIQTPNFQLTNSSLTFNGSGTFAGNLVAVNGTLANLTINPGGAINSGAFTGYAWPPAGPENVGFHLGTEGLLLGNLNNSRYVQFTKNGEFYIGNPSTNMVSDASGFRVNGPLIATGNVLNDAITITSTSYSAFEILMPQNASAVQVQATTIVTTGLKVLILAGFYGEYNLQIGQNANSNKVYIEYNLYLNGNLLTTTTSQQAKPNYEGSIYTYVASGGGETTLMFSHTPAAGINIYSVTARIVGAGQNGLTFEASVKNRSLFAMEIKR
jgi:hypothetical protein